MKTHTTVAIVGAGPYGLSLAAHLSRRRIPFRIFGPPMEVWRTQMPSGMQLKSDGFASDLYDPERSFTLKRFCQDRRIPYADYGMPVELKTFVEYALEFQRKFVPNLETTSVSEVRRDGDDFALRLEHGGSLTAQSVVMATGISHFQYVPEPLCSLPPELCTHSGEHHDLSGFRNLRVVVIGGGASATDMAALLRSAGASVRLVSRAPVEFHLPPGNKPRSIWKRITEPNLGLGPSFRSAVYTAVPGLFHRLPRNLRLRIVRRHLGPAGGWFIKEQVIGKVQLDENYTVQTATSRQGVVSLRLAHRKGTILEVEADHVISATGYHPSTARLRLLEQGLRSALQLEEQSPTLSSAFESSAPGLYFIGVASANSFGPVMRFARGAEYAAGRLSAHLERVYSEKNTKRHTETARSL